MRERDTCTPTCTNNYTAKIVIRHANCLPRLCLTDILCLHCQTHMESNRKHLILFITAASISHRSKIDILEETQTDAHKHTHNLPLIQNTSRTNRKIPSIFFFSLRERAQAASHKQQAEQVTWQRGRKVIAMVLIYFYSYSEAATHTCTRFLSACVHINPNIHANSIWFLNL